MYHLNSKRSILPGKIFIRNKGVFRFNFQIKIVNKKVDQVTSTCFGYFIICLLTRVDADRVWGVYSIFMLLEVKQSYKDHILYLQLVRKTKIHPTVLSVSYQETWCSIVVCFAN